jgi:hypothetical protein
MIDLTASSSGFSPPRRQERQGIPLFSRVDVATIKRIREIVGKRIPITEAPVQKKTFVNPWCSWCLGGSDFAVGRGRGVYLEATNEGAAI